MHFQYTLDWTSLSKYLCRVMYPCITFPSPSSCILYPEPLYPCHIITPVSSTLNPCVLVIVYSCILHHKHLYPCSKGLLHNSFWELIYPGTTQILLTINVNTQLQSPNYRCQIKGHDTQSVYQNRKPHKFDPWPINTNTTGRDLVSYWYQLKGFKARIYKISENRYNVVKLSS